MKGKRKRKALDWDKIRAEANDYLFNGCSNSISDFEFSECGPAIPQNWLQFEAVAVQAYPSNEQVLGFFYRVVIARQYVFPHHVFYSLN